MSTGTTILQGLNEMQISWIKLQILIHYDLDGYQNMRFLIRTLDDENINGRQTNLARNTAGKDRDSVSLYVCMCVYFTSLLFLCFMWIHFI